MPAGSVRAGFHEELPDVAFTTLVSELRRRIRGNVDWSMLGNMRLLGSLATELSLGTADQNNHYWPGKSLTYVRELPLHPDIDRDLSQIRNGLCVDVGCGGINPVGPLFALLLAGAGRGIAIDLDAIESLGNATRALYDLFATVITDTSFPRIHASPEVLLERVRSFDLAKLLCGDASGIDRSRLDFVQKPLSEAGLVDESVDPFLSTAFFEHVPDPEAIIGEMARHSRPGAFGWHVIDGADHRMYSDSKIHPLEFLRDPSGDVMVHGSNRVRPLEFASMFEKHGFEVRGVSPVHQVELNDEQVAAFAERYREMPRELLETVSATFYLRKR